LHVVKKNPERTVDLTLKKIPESSALFKTFEKNVRIVQNSVTYENNYKVTWFTFAYIPYIQQQAKEQPKNEGINPTGQSASSSATAQANPAAITKGVVA
jgi:hypothetical protein